jgi:hypothetical protein
VETPGQARILALALPRCARLKFLSLSGNGGLGDAGAEALADALVRVATLEVLELMACGAAAVASFCAAVLTDIHLSNVCSCQEILRRRPRPGLGDSGARSLKRAVQWCGELRRLDVRLNRFTNQGVGFLFASWDARAAEHHPVRDAMPELEILLDEETASRTSEDPDAEAFVIPQKKPWEY